MDEKDPELEAMKSTTETLNALDEDARERVVAYLAGRFLPLAAIDRVRERIVAGESGEAPPRARRPT